MDSLEALDAVLRGGESLSRDDARALMTSLLQGGLGDEQIADLLTTLNERGETAAELAGFSDAMRSAATRLPLTDEERDQVVDTCGTGGDGSGSFNISTAVALVAAAAGIKIAKHGNRKVTSRCGSADVLEALGISVDHTPKSAVEALREHGFAFLLATTMHPAMKRVRHIRQGLPFRTVFNLLGPMTNPAGARRQVIGVYSADAVPLVASALAERGDMLHAMVVHGSGGLDELSISGSSIVAEVRGNHLHISTVSPGDAGLLVSGDILPGGGARQNASVLNAVFAGEKGVARDTVLLNTAAVLVVAGAVQDLRSGATMASRVIDSGRVARLVVSLASD